jgi:hypothetical protein
MKLKKNKQKNDLRQYKLTHQTHNQDHGLG